MQLEGRVVVVTGISGNLGAITAKRLLKEGARIVGLDRHAAHAEETFTSSIAQQKVIALEADLTDEDAALAALAKAKEAGFGPVTGLVCTVGAWKGGTNVAASGWAEWQSMLDANLKTAVACTRAALPSMLAEKRGSIVHVAALAALSGLAGQAAYSAAKGALLRFNEALAQEVKADGVRVNAVMPGTLDTPQNRAWMSIEDAEKAVRLDAVADVIAFLLSDAARAVTSSAIRVTGLQ